MPVKSAFGRFVRKKTFVKTLGIDNHSESNIRDSDGVFYIGIRVSLPFYSTFFSEKSDFFFILAPTFDIFDLDHTMPFINLVGK